MSDEDLDAHTFSCRPIGIIRTPFTEREGTPIQPVGAEGVKGTVEVDSEFAPGLKDLDGFSHVFLLYHFHRSSGWTPEVIPFMDDQPRGVFATRAPSRPNPIGISLVRLERVDGAILHVEDVDILDGTPLLDIKPYLPEFDSREVTARGWLEENSDKAREIRADGRFR
jgi:tRNA-Thr(GGU) m(6)t(6)A37 methyltransferase TsaA